MNRSITRALLAGSAALAMAGGTQAHDHAVSRGRLVYADHQAPRIHVLDLDSGETTHSFDVPDANPSLSTTENGRYIVIKTGDAAGTVRFLDTGLTFESHGDHVDVHKGEVRMLDFALSGDKPAHVVSDSGWVSVFFDGHRPWERASDPHASFIALDSLGTPEPTTVTWKSPAPQHGIAFALGRDEWLVSTPNAAYAAGDQTASSRPNGFQVVASGGERVLASFDNLADPQNSCKEYHGHAPREGVHVFGCAGGPADHLTAGGLLVMSRADTGWQARRLPYPDARRSSTVKAGKAGALVANYGSVGPYDALLRIDPAAKTLAAADVFPVPGGQAVCHFEVSANGRRVANLTPDGRLRIYEMSPDWKQVAQFDAVPAFDCAYGAKTPTPNLALVGESIFVSDPLGKRIREYGIGTLRQGLDLPVDGVPANLAGGD
ncbi:hypothetical protein [Microvirga pudoricolor]|uniref:hypothetical protein n=1 Tax=Microvirga pudoricolor TaxID=2778729 RepID=UPI00194E9CD6|nr:hypothetical protein [Microvirga pudoricolor]MBM6593376.1 hypothetical protein [Microvirga pudoricolor]